MGAWEEYDTVPTLGLQSLLDNQQLWHNQRNHIHWGENKIQEEIKRSRLALITKSSIKNNNKDSFWDAPAFLFSVKAGYASSLWLQPFPVVSVSVGAGSWGNKKRRTITRDDDVSVRDGNFSLIFLFFFLIITPTWVVASVSKALLSFLIWRWGFNKGGKKLSVADITAQLRQLKMHFYQLLLWTVWAGLAEVEAAVALHHLQCPVKIHTEVCCRHSVFNTFHSLCNLK